MRRSAVWLLGAFVVLAVGCGDPVDPGDSGTPEPGVFNPDPQPNPNPDPMPEPDPDPEPDPLPDPDPGPNPEPDPNPDPDPVPQGERRLLLQGAVMAPEGVIDPGQVLVVGDTIICVAEDCTMEPEAMDARLINTDGIISPGLVDSHNHLAYNFLPEWVPDRLYTNRYQWSDEPSYEAHIRPYTAHRSSNSHFCPAARWGELRSLLHGTTTMQGQSFSRTCTSGWVRNADQAHNLQHDHMRTTIGSVRDINDETAQGYLESFNDPIEPVTRFAVHMGEGVSDNRVDEEFDSFVGRDPRPNRHAGQTLMVDGVAILIHAVAVTAEQLAEAAAANAFVVWSPSSNIVLYGETADIGRILDLGIVTGISPDWTISGEDNMLGELRFANDYARQENIAQVTPRKLWEMATSDGAEVVGLHGFIGRLEPGQRADITVFERNGDDAFESILDSGAEDVKLVLINGEGYYGDAAYQRDAARHNQCETIDVCGNTRFLCIREPAIVNDWSDETLEDIQQQLIDIMEGTPEAPDDEQYGRGDELLDLFECR